MASASPYSDAAARTRQRSVASPLHRLVGSAIRFVGFWAAIVLPFVLLTLTATGVATQHPAVAAGLVVGNLAGLRLGRNYNR
jgi:hypothetical protein